MGRHICFAGFLFCAHSLANLALAADNALMPSVMPSLTSAIADVTPTVRNNPDYPVEALNIGLDGWVWVSFSVVPDGTTADAIALRSSDAGFEPGALRAVSRWKYELPPEMLGARGASFQTVIKFNIERQDDRTAFMSIFRGTEPLLDAGERDEVLERLPRAYEKIKTLRDGALYQWLVYRVASANGAGLIAADALDMMEPVVDLLSSELVIRAVEARIALAIANGELKKARNWIDWARANETLKADATYAAFIEALDASQQTLASRLASTDPLPVTGRSLRQYWTHELSHHEFALGDVQIERQDERGVAQQLQGEVKSLQVRCLNRSAQHLDVLIDSGYKIPDAWEGCFVVVEADPGTTFVLTEYPPEPSAAE
jgi:TonB family protein